MQNSIKLDKPRLNKNLSNTVMSYETKQKRFNTPITACGKFANSTSIIN